MVRRDPSARGSASIVIALAGQIASHNLQAMHLRKKRRMSFSIKIVLKHSPQHFPERIFNLFFWIEKSVFPSPHLPQRKEVLQLFH